MSITASATLPHIALVAGGFSQEHDVSLRSAATIIKNIDKTRFTPYLVCVPKEGADWFVLDGEAQYPIDKNDFSFITPQGQRICFDYAFITIHGTPGENGLLQGYFDLLGIPYNTGGVLAEALTFDKYACNHFLASFGVRIARSQRLLALTSSSSQTVLQQLSLPLFVKPNVGGSSIATTKVTTEEQLMPALELAFREAHEVIVEEFIGGTEVTSGCYIIGDQATPLPLTEVELKGSEFFDYEAKYMGASNEITPARIAPALTEEIQQLTCSIAQILRLQGIIRVDYIIESDGKPTLIEVNTTPGMTDASFIPQQVAAAGLSLRDLFTSIINYKLS